MDEVRVGNVSWEGTLGFLGRSEVAAAAALFEFTAAASVFRMPKQLHS